MSKRTARAASLEELSRQNPKAFWPNGQGREHEAVVEEVEVRKVEESGPSIMSAETIQALVTTPEQGFLLACGDGMDLPIDRAKFDIQESAGRMLEDYVRIGKRLFVLKAKLGQGNFGRYMEEEFPMSYRVGRECMLLAKRVMESKLADVRQFHRVIAGNSKQKALLLMGVSDEEIEAAQKSDEFLGRSLEEVGELSYRQLKEELRKRERDLERARAQRDKAESKVNDLEEVNQKLRSTDDPEESKQVSPLWRGVERAVYYMGKVRALYHEAPDEEQVADGGTILHRFQDEMDLCIRLFQPLPPGAPIPQEKGGGR